MTDKLNKCKSEIDLMLKRSKTKVIFPIITYGLLVEYQNTKKEIFTDIEIKILYENSVQYFKDYLGHDLHIGGKYYDAYPSRNLPKYGVLKVIDNKKYLLTDIFKENSGSLINYIPNKIKEYIILKLGELPLFEDAVERINIAQEEDRFKNIIIKHININDINFEIFSFAILKVHLEKFACKIYRDTRTSAHDKGVDLSTNFGVIYQIKKLKLINTNSAKNVYNELQLNFSEDRIKDGNLILVIDDISKDVKSYMINMKIQTIVKSDLLKISDHFDVEDRMKVLRIVYEEFSREYKSVI